MDRLDSPLPTDWPWPYQQAVADAEVVGAYPGDEAVIVEFSDGMEYAIPSDKWADYCDYVWREVSLRFDWENPDIDSVPIISGPMAWLGLDFDDDDQELEEDWA